MSIGKKFIFGIVTLIIMCKIMEKEVEAVDKNILSIEDIKFITPQNISYIEGGSLAQEVFIEGIYENSTLYVGGDLRIKGYVDLGATVKEISWQLTGQPGIIDFNPEGNNARIEALSPGSVWVMARATDGSDRAREYTVRVEAYPRDAASMVFIGENIIPIQRRSGAGNIDILQVEVNKALTSSQEKVRTLESYIIKLAGIGTLSNDSLYSDDYYEYYIIDISGKKVEVRVDKNNSSYDGIKNILLDVSKYNGNKQEENQEIDKKPENKPSEEKNPNLDNNEEIKPPANDDSENVEVIQDSKEEVLQGVDNIVILGGTGASENDPIAVTVEESLTSQEKVNTMIKYIETLKARKELSFVRREDFNKYTSYIFKVSEKGRVERGIRSSLKNDFFIEIRVNKDDKEAYEPIIEMLDKVNGDKGNEAENKIAEDEIDDVKENEENLDGEQCEEGFYAGNNKGLKSTSEDKNSTNRVKEQENYITEREIIKVILVGISSIIGVVLFRRRYRKRNK